jgi:hypothetical protein
MVRILRRIDSPFRLFSRELTGQTFGGGEALALIHSEIGGHPLERRCARRRQYSIEYDPCLSPTGPGRSDMHSVNPARPHLVLCGRFTYRADAV